jgi:hypothetical protein
LCVNTLDLGGEAKPGHWKCPVENENEVGDCSFTDVQAKNVEQKLPEIIDRALKLYTSRPQAWKDVVLKMRKIMTTLRQRGHFSDDQIKAVELELNAWTDEWISIVGKEGMTNYTHCMSSGRVVYYSRLWRNCYRYSNQGWYFLAPSTAMSTVIGHKWVDHQELLVRQAQK